MIKICLHGLPKYADRQTGKLGGLWEICTSSLGKLIASVTKQWTCSLVTRTRAGWFYNYWSKYFRSIVERGNYLISSKPCNPREACREVFSPPWLYFVIFLKIQLITTHDRCMMGSMFKASSLFARILIFFFPKCDFSLSWCLFSPIFPRKGLWIYQSIFTMMTPLEKKS